MLLLWERLVAPTQREQAELTALRVLDEYQRTGALPGPLIRHMQASAWRNGRVLTEEQVARSAREWADRMLAAVDAGAHPESVE